MTLETREIETAREDVIPHRKLIQNSSKNFCFKGWISTTNDRRGERSCFQL